MLWRCVPPWPGSESSLPAVDEGVVEQRLAVDVGDGVHAADELGELPVAPVLHRRVLARVVVRPGVERLFVVERGRALVAMVGDDPGAAAEQRRDRDVDRVLVETSKSLPVSCAGGVHFGGSAVIRVCKSASRSM